MAASPMSGLVFKGKLGTNFPDGFTDAGKFGLEHNYGSKTGYNDRY